MFKAFAFRIPALMSNLPGDHRFASALNPPFQEHKLLAPTMQRLIAMMFSASDKAKARSLRSTKRLGPISRKMPWAMGNAKQLDSPNRSKCNDRKISARQSAEKDSGCN